MSTTTLDQPPSAPSPAYNPPVPVIVTVIFLLSFLFGFFTIHFCKCILESLITNRPSVEIITTDASDTVLTDDTNKSNGLDPELIQAFPTFYYSTVKEFRIEKYGLECAICLGEFEDDDLLRLLTICCHVFHKECVDLWLESNKTCPVCRRELDAPRKSLDKSPMLLHSNSMHEIGASNQNQSSPLRNAVCIDIKEDIIEDRNKAEAQSSSSNTKERHRIFRSNSTGHSIARIREEDDSKYRLKLLDHVKIRIVRGHKSTISCISFRDFNSPLSYTNVASGEGSN
ncbi:Arabidopsis Toxicos en Levadura 29 [Hibiscus trionum]|uniref:RING-type E3 ubiquitin transferase n=1 Tax=Hibiscus trionum TaxID=183268 RepID=A0A9W7IJC1_HIBTR|nr:Arabidopsis Toxicos en Levadura 29 [Hibiscus trionum]